MQSLCTLRHHCRQWPRNTRYQAGATPYLGRTSTGWFAPACGWGPYSITSSAPGSSGRGPAGAGALGGFGVNHELELGRGLHWKIGWFLALEDPVDVTGRAPVLVNKIRPVGEQPAGGDEIPGRVDSRNAVASNSRCDQIA